MTTSWDLLTVATLPPVAASQGSSFVVTDATVSEAAGAGSIVAGGGTTRVRVRSDGTNWRVWGTQSKGAGASIIDSFVNAVVASGGTVSAGRKTAINTLIASLAPIWPKLSRLGLLAAENVQSAKVDLVDPTKVLTFTGSITFTTDQGLNNDGAVSYIDTGFTLPDGRYTQDNAHHSIGTLSTRAVGADVVAIGNVQLAGGSGVWLWSTANTVIAPVNASSVFGGTTFAHPGASVKGFYVNNRTLPAATQMYYNGSSVATTVHTTATPSSTSMLIGAWRNSDGVSVYARDNGIMSVWSAGASLNAAEALLLTTAINTYMTTLGHALF